jgi:hypothetical protein
MVSYYFDRLALIANKTASVAARLEELEQLREQVKRAERMAAPMPALDPKGLKSGARGLQRKSLDLTD